MNFNPQPSNSNHPRGHPREIDQAVLLKNHNFVGREFVFTALNNFLSRHNRGYFTIVGAPGSGKTAILTKYVAENSDVIDYDAQVEGKNRVEEFLTDICQEIIETYSSTFFAG